MLPVPWLSSAKSDPTLCPLRQRPALTSADANASQARLESYNLFLTFNRYGSERCRVSLMTDLDDVLNSTRNAKAG